MRTILNSELLLKDPAMKLKVHPVGIGADLDIDMDNSERPQNVYSDEPGEKSDQLALKVSAEYEEPPPAYDPHQQQHVPYYVTVNSMNCNGDEKYPDIPIKSPDVTIVTVKDAAPIGQTSFCCSYLFSCLVFWFCGFVFGGIAFILSVVGSKRQCQGNIISARKLSWAALALNIIGCILGCAAWGVLIWFLYELVTFLPCTNFGGTCYRYTTCSISRNQCYEFFPSRSYYYGSCCYYNDD